MYTTEKKFKCELKCKINVVFVHWEIWEISWKIKFKVL